jgi:hypothetical protein
MTVTIMGLISTLSITALSITTLSIHCNTQHQVQRTMTGDRHHNTQPDETQLNDIQHNNENLIQHK